MMAPLFISLFLFLIMSKNLNCVLLVDDNPAFNLISRKVIEKFKEVSEIATVLNGIEAVDFLTNSGKYADKGDKYPQPDLILLDLNMPLMDGWEFLEEYDKIDPRFKGDAIIVMLTTSLNPDDQGRAANNSHISGFRNKPLTASVFQDILDNYFAEG